MWAKLEVPLFNVRLHLVQQCCDSYLGLPTAVRIRTPGTLRAVNAPETPGAPQAHSHEGTESDRGRPALFQAGGP